MTRESFRWGILVEGARGSFRWEILVEGARGSASRSASAVSKSSLLFVRAEKSARSLELPAATRIGIYVKLEACQARTGGIQFQRSFSGTFQAAGLLQMQNTPGWNTPRPQHIIPSASPHTIPPLKRWSWQGFLSLQKTAGRRRKADPL